MKLLLVGLGSMGSYHIKKFTNLGIEIIGGIDPNPIKRETAKERFGIKYCFEKIDDFKESVDAISIAVPDSLHKKCYLEAKKFNVPLFLEKPLTCNLEDALEVEKEIGNNAVVNYSKRNVKALYDLKKIIDINLLGKINSVECIYHQNWLLSSPPEWQNSEKSLWRLSPLYSGGGCVADLGSHLFDCLFLLFGKVKFLETNFSLTFPQAVNKGIIEYENATKDLYHIMKEADDDQPKNIIDYNGSFSVGDGIICKVACSFLSDKYKEATIIKVIGEKGIAQINTSIDRKQVFLSDNIKYETNFNEIIPTYTMFKNFVDYKTRQDEYLPTVHKAVEIQKILQEILF